MPFPTSVTESCSSSSSAVCSIKRLLFVTERQFVCPPSSECAKKSECHLGQRPEGIEEGKGSGPIEVQRQGKQKVSYMASNSICLPPVQT